VGGNLVAAHNPKTEPTNLKEDHRAMKIAASVIVFSACMFGTFVFAASTQQSKKPFTVADDIAYDHFVPDGYASGFVGSEGIVFSPNGELFAVLTSRGLLEQDEVEDSLRFYRTQDVASFLNRAEQSQPPSPIWVVNRTGKKEPIANFRWLPDSSGVGLLEHTKSGDNQADDHIVLLDLKDKTSHELPGEVASYQAFDISDREHYVYVATDQEAVKELEAKEEARHEASMAPFTGSTAYDLFFHFPKFSAAKNLWAVIGRKRFKVQYNGAPLTDADFRSGTLALSPDGQSVVTELRVKNIPEAWERLFVRPYPSAPFNNIHAGGSAMQYVRIDLKTGAIQPLTDAPTSSEAGWMAEGDGQPSWSSDGQAILLPGTFIKPDDGKPSRPCVAVIDIVAKTRTCVELLKSRTGPGDKYEGGYHWILSVRFAGGDKNRIEMTFMYPEDETTGTIEFKRMSDGKWQVAGETKGLHHHGPNGLEISIKQWLDQPPILVASNSKTSSVLWDPNPQFKDLDLGQVKVYEWKDKYGREWQGGLYMPAGYQPGHRYPLVIQTHGFSESWFSPSGAFPSAFAARAFASAGIAVLQIGGGKQCGSLISDEASCEASGFESAVKQLVAEGMVDAQKVGYIGFSRSCWYGMDTLTLSSVLKTAVLADGLTGGYLDYLLFGVDPYHEGQAPVPGFGEGLEIWEKKSAGFHLDKVTAPVLVAVSKNAALSMWQPYAGLRDLKKPVDMVLINSDEHPMTNPKARMASQGLSVDWFRFWLQGYEDPDPSKAEQYKRWHELRALQAENEKKPNNSQATSN
jgi:hypothetical protein